MSEVGWDLANITSEVQAYLDKHHNSEVLWDLAKHTSEVESYLVEAST